jgi:HEPN domain-containing protein
MHPHEHSALLMRKASLDEVTGQKLVSDSSAPDEVIGFHAQQAVEKMPKAVLAARGVHCRRTHDLVELLDLLRVHGITYPGELEDIRRLTPFAAAYRYDEVPEEAEQLFDRAWALECLRKVKAWCELTLAG